MNPKSTSKSMASKAAKILANPEASDIQKTLAGSVLSQIAKDNQTSSKMEDIASKVLQSSKYNDLTKSLAGSVLSQAEKER
ncbi:hypothetical protein UNSWDHB_312 [Dehalobacter sp. UNSWDHB]|jgi:hypothetical protein|uniref:hypothetical protein n=1 Tax=unclassified Dehalobacter TaxID=2635733 RepID=UPI00028AB851|nr:MULTISPECIES: hypothetical protein [unclassified Dehalobacter]AFV03487.1 hypothetical protein DHBDCA_p2460 [Dehalobacter sp. DCA]AFV06473.1 hypothetical protein DCF50_p2470 [Dehalobacter sp. CF]EQB22359.1 hypothetical protein UNSWDHB_312 [Dehalobacter sp. UNSWDHB]